MAATKAGKKSAKRGGKTTKKPKWTVVTYKQIEARRVELGYSKQAMAEMLGVTNSTYHNWRRGTTVPHANQQAQIKTIMASMPSVKSAKGTRKGAKGRGASKARSGSPSGVKRGHTGDVGRGGSTMTSSFNDTHPISPTQGQITPDVATITGAWINAQKSAPSAGSVFKFVRELKAALIE